MLYIIFGTDFKKREIAKGLIKKSLEKNNIDIDSLLRLPKINKDNFSSIENYTESTSLFGETLFIEIEDILTKEDSREYFYENFNKMLYSQNIFLMDEAYALSPVQTKVKTLFEKMNLSKNIYDAKEENKIKDIEPFYLAELIEKRDKKRAWVEFQKIYLQWGDDEAQALHGAIWWKWKNIMSAFTEGNKSNYFKIYRLSDSKINYSREELEEFGFELSLMAMKANNGEENLMRSIEKFILKI